MSPELEIFKEFETIKKFVEEKSNRSRTSFLTKLLDIHRDEFHMHCYISASLYLLNPCRHIGALVFGVVY